VGIENLLRLKGAPEQCYLLTENAKLDGRHMRLDEALPLIVGSGFGALISCIPAQLAYFEGEEAMDRYILVRSRT
jgi:hypothetical protein